MMRFLNREHEIARLDGLLPTGGLAVLYGRRRVGKTRLLVEWVRRHDGVYTVADQSAPEVQRRYLAEAIAARLPGFGDVEYRDWRSLLTRLARDATAAGWTGPLVLDELPYLVHGSPELPAVLQRWIDHDASALSVVVAGSSQHMMQGLVLAGDAPLYGRAREIMDVLPLSPTLLPEVFGPGLSVVELYAAWGGVPRYWELAAGVSGSLERRIDRLVLDPLGPLHREPDRLIVEELPPATEVRPLLDAIGGGAHRVSEIAARLGRPATSLSRPITRLQGMGLVQREVPFGESERMSKRSLYRIADPFTRMWFRVVAPHRAQLATSTAEGRLLMLRQAWPQLCGAAWEDLCRLLLPMHGVWEAPARWWRGNEPEWDLVARSLDGRRVLLGEAKLRVTAVARAWAELQARPAPAIVGDAEVVRALFVERVVGAVPAGAVIVTAEGLLHGPGHPTGPQQAGVGRGA